MFTRNDHWTVERRGLILPAIEGISKATAQTLLLLAFVQQVIDKLDHEEIRAELSEKL